MKKVKEVADELNVSRQSVYNWLQKLEPEINRFVKQVEGVKVIEEPGIEMIRDNLKVDKQDDEGVETASGAPGPAREIELLQEQIQQLKEQNEYLKEQIDRKDRRLDNYQVLIKQRTDRVEMLEGEVEKQQEGLIERIKSFFRR